MAANLDESKLAQQIVVQCSCGKRMLAKTQHAGKRLKCPACGHAVVVAPQDDDQPQMEGQSNESVEPLDRGAVSQRRKRMEASPHDIPTTAAESNDPLKKVESLSGSPKSLFTIMPGMVEADSDTESHGLESGTQPPKSSSKQKKTCPFCGEEILLSAIKCKHCGEFLDGRNQVAEPQAKSKPLQLTQPAALSETAADARGPTSRPSHVTIEQTSKRIKAGRLLVWVLSAFGTILLLSGNAFLITCGILMLLGCYGGSLILRFMKWWGHG